MRPQLYLDTAARFHIFCNSECCLNKVNDNGVGSRSFDSIKQYIERLLGNNLLGCGELTFNQFDVEKTKFIVVKNIPEQGFEGYMDSIKKCLFDDEGLSIQKPKPKFLLSVTGGAKKFTVSNDIILAFKSALTKVAANTNALIVSGGLDIGVMSVVGDAVKEDLNGGNQPVLGIASWRRSKLQHKDSGDDIKDQFLRNLDRNNPKFIGNEDFFNREKENNLDPKHSCFIFVDNGHEGEHRGEIQFRAELEHSIAKELEIPLILIALEGGVGTLETICHMIRNEHPVLLIDKTGGCADLIRDLLELKHTEEENIEDAIENLLNNKKYAALVSKDDKKTASRSKENQKAARSKYKKSKEEADKKESTRSKYKKSKEEADKKESTRSKDKKSKEETDKKKSTRRYLKLIATDNYGYIKIFRITGNETKEKIEDQIFDALIRVKSTNNDYRHKMRLAISWNRLDKAKESLSKLHNEDDLDKLKELLKQALLENKAEFAALIMSKVKIKQFLSKEMLDDLYNNEWINSKRPHHEPLYAFLQKHKKIENSKITFKAVGDFLKQNFDTLNPSSFLPNDSNNDEKVNAPEWNLFLWCVMSNRIASAKLFWKIGSHQICDALIASKILKYFSKMSYSTEDKALFTKLADEFEQLAISVLNVFEENTRDYINDVLVIRYLKYIRMDCLQLANESQCEQFLAHRVVQNALDKIWKGKEECNWRSGVLSKYEKSLMYCQNEYNEKKEYIFGNSYLSSKKSHPVWRFFCTPRTKFGLHVISYLLFLIFFTTTMLLKESIPINDVNDNSSKNSDTNSYKNQSLANESLLLVWIVMLLADEFRQAFRNNYPRYSLKIKLKKYFQQEWNMFDVIGCLIFIVGFILICFNKQQHEEVHRWGRLLLSIDLAIWYIRALQLCFVLERLGPKILMIRKMVGELAYFLIIIVVFIAAFGISVESIMSPYENYNSSNILSSILDKAYWPIYGELRLLDKLNDDDCGNDTGKPCLDRLTLGSSYALLMVYMVIASVLLINLLIAMFTTIFDKIQSKSDIIWKNQRYMFIAGYVDSPFLPPPLNLIAYVLYGIHFVKRVQHGNNENNEYADSNLIDEDEDVLKEMERKFGRRVLSEYQEYNK